MYSTFRLVLLLSAACAVLCYRPPPPRGGSYSLPNIGGFPAPQPTFPRNHGLPDAYKNVRFRRSMDDQYPPVNDQFVEESAYEDQEDETHRLPRSADLLEEEQQAYVDAQAELQRERRSSGFRVIQPTYRPPPPRPQKPIWV